jgi:hypothetical protein
MDPLTMALFILVCIVFVVLVVRGRIEHRDARSTQTPTHAVIDETSMVTRGR